jgi:hypothetical protein
MEYECSTNGCAVDCKDRDLRDLRHLQQHSHDVDPLLLIHTTRVRTVFAKTEKPVCYPFRTFPISSYAGHLQQKPIYEASTSRISLYSRTRTFREAHINLNRDEHAAASSCKYGHTYSYASDHQAKGLHSMPVTQGEVRQEIALL